MKSKLIGAVILAAVVVCAAMYYLFGSQPEVTVISGYLGGEKIGVMEDKEISDILAKNHHISFNYSRAGSLDMVTAEQTGRIIFSHQAELLSNTIRNSMASLSPMRLFSIRL